MKLSKNKKGFTLVELLLVMAIIGILAGIIFISIGPARKRARITAFKKAMQDVATAATLCIDSGSDLNTKIVADGGSNACKDADAVGNIPEIKVCSGKNEPIADIAVEGTGDDFILTATCPVVGGKDKPDVKCLAKCTMNGCRFDNDDTATDNDGCPKTKKESTDN
jgi:prepilin-type N-terminal cleavage/methylation domain-containing protein